MPLKETEFGKVCPLGKWEIDIIAGGGIYTADPVEACLNCNFGNIHAKVDFEEDLRNGLPSICKCPLTMTSAEYTSLKDSFRESIKDCSEMTRQNFQAYVRENYSSEIEIS